VNKKQDNARFDQNFSSDWIQHLETETHWRLYWNQMSLIFDDIKPNERILEIGKGNGFTSNYLKSKKINVVTMDIDNDKKPDIVADILTHDWGGNIYDRILAFEVFEHIPYCDFLQVLGKLSTACKYLYFSVPVNEKIWMHLDVQMPKNKKLCLKIVTKRKKIRSKYHYWEINTGVSRRRLTQDLQNSAFKICKQKKVLSKQFFKLASVDESVML